MRRSGSARASSAYPETKRWSQPSSHAGSSSSGRSVGRGASVRGHRALAVRIHERADHSRPGPRPGPTTATPRRCEPGGATAPASSAPRLPMKRDCAPSSATQAATFAAWPPGARRISASRVAAGRDRPVEPDDHVERRGRRACRPAWGGDRKIWSWTARSDAGGVRSFLLGGLLGASAALAAIDRRRRRAAPPRASARARRVRERALLPRAPRPGARARRPAWRARSRASLRRPCRSTSTVARTGTRSRSSRR